MFDGLIKEAMEENQQRNAYRAVPGIAINQYHQSLAIMKEFDCLHFVLGELFPKKYKKAIDKWNKEMKKDAPKKA